MVVDPREGRDMPARPLLPVVRPEGEGGAHSDFLRILFVSAGVLIILALPWYGGFLQPLPNVVSILFAATLILSAALFDERETRWLAAFDLVLSLVGFTLAAYAASAPAPGDPRWVIVARQIMAVVFAAATYAAGRVLVRKIRRPRYGSVVAQERGEA